MAVAFGVARQQVLDRHHAGEIQDEGDRLAVMVGERLVRAHLLDVQRVEEQEPQVLSRQQLRHVLDLHVLRVRASVGVTESYDQGARATTAPYADEGMSGMASPYARCLHRLGGTSPATRYLLLPIASASCGTSSQLGVST